MVDVIVVNTNAQVVGLMRGEAVLSNVTVEASDGRGTEIRFPVSLFDGVKVGDRFTIAINRVEDES